MTWGFQLLITGMIGAITYFWKKQSDRIDAGMKKLSDRVEQVDAKRDELQKELAALKADLPLVYVLREDFLRVMNNVDTKLDQLLYKHKGNGG
ncbi:MAG TPA: hypothetical protein VN626_11045 [Clostridia bacterium]|nr:hypothetical protein [Clostridia bacterium]